MMKSNVTQEEVMIDIPHHPQLEVISKGLFNHYWFRKDKKYHCSNCGSIYEEDWISCPNCHIRGTSRLITKRTNFNNFIEEYRVDVMQVHEGRIAFRQYSIIQRIVNLRKSIEIEEIGRDVIYKGELHQFHKRNIDHKNNYYAHYERIGDRWSFGRLNENERVRRPIKYFHIHPESYEKELIETEVKYTMVGKFIDSTVDDCRYLAQRYIHAAAKYPWVEYVYKLGGLNLYKDIINFSADMRVVRKQSVKKYIKFIKEYNPSAMHFYMRVMSDESKSKLSDQFIMSHTGWVGNVLPLFRKMNQLCKMTGFSYERIDRYIDSNKAHCSKGTSLTIDEYFDYLNMMIKLNCPPTSELLAFPKDFKNAHDDAVKKFNAIKLEIKNQSYQNFLINLMVLEFSDNGLSVIVPKNLVEIVQEGKSLSHCVGSYVDSVQNGKTIILFIRKTNEIDKPYYTLEYRNKHVVQCRGRNNKSTTPEIDKFVDDWINWLNRPKQKKVRVQPSQMITMQG